MSFDFGFNFAPSFQKLKASRIDRFRSNIQYTKSYLQHEEMMLQIHARELAKWSDPEASYIDSFVLKDANKTIQTKDFRDEFVLKLHAVASLKLEKSKKHISEMKIRLENDEQKYAEELKFENETFQEFKTRVSKESSNG